MISPLCAAGATAAAAAAVAAATGAIASMVLIVIVSITKLSKLKIMNMFIVMPDMNIQLSQGNHFVFEFKRFLLHSLKVAYLIWTLALTLSISWSVSPYSSFSLFSQTHSCQLKEKSSNPQVVPFFPSATVCSKSESRSRRAKLGIKRERAMSKLAARQSLRRRGRVRIVLTTRREWDSVDNLVCCSLPICLYAKALILCLAGAYEMDCVHLQLVRPLLPSPYLLPTLHCSDI